MADVPVLAPAAEVAAPAAKGKKTLIFVILLAVLLLAGGGVGAWFAFMPHGKKHETAKKEPPAPKLPDDVVTKTAAKYQEALERLTGQTLA